MKRISLSLLCFLAVLIGATSCSKDFDSNASYKDVTVMYGILNSADQDHYIKIYKGFLTDGDASEAAQVYDSLYYGDELSVVVEEYLNGKLKATIPLVPVTDIPRELDGDFAAPEQLLYKFTRPLDPDATYKIVATNAKTGRVVTAETDLVGSFGITCPTAYVRDVGIHSDMQSRVEFTAAAHSSSYDVYQSFYYIERDRATGNEVKKCIRRKLNSSMLTTNVLQYTPSLLLDVIAGVVKPSDKVDRYVTADSCLRFEVWAVNETLGRYFASSNIAGSVVLDRLDYTNVECEDGRVAGVLGSRRFADGWHGITRASQEELAYGHVTGNLNFHTVEDYENLHNR